MRTVYYCLNGFGYFGSRSLRSAIQLAPLLPAYDPPSELRFFCIADPSEERKGSARGALQSLDIDTRKIKFLDNLDAILTAIRLQVHHGVHENDIFLIHDCSPTPLHHVNVARLRDELTATPALRDRIRYLVEKPAMTAVAFGEFLDIGTDFRLPPHCFCDYIELPESDLLSGKGLVDCPS